MFSFILFSSLKGKVTLRIFWKAKEGHFFVRRLLLMTWSILGFCGDEQFQEVSDEQGVLRKPLFVFFLYDLTFFVFEKILCCEEGDASGFLRIFFVFFFQFFVLILFLYALNARLKMEQIQILTLFRWEPSKKRHIPARKACSNQVVASAGFWWCVRSPAATIVGNNVHGTWHTAACDRSGDVWHLQPPSKGVQGLG